MVVIPAPLYTDALSKEVLRSLGNEPILVRLIRVAFRTVVHRNQVVVLTDDDEVALLAERQSCAALVMPDARGERGVGRPRQIRAAMEHAEEACGCVFCAVAVLYPTVPLVSEEDLQRGIATLFEDERCRSVLSACESTHRTWTKKSDGIVVESEPQYSEGGEPASFREVPSFVISRREVLAADRLVEEPIGLALIPRARTWEIRSAHDWFGLNRLVGRRRIVFVVTGNRAIGLGHVYRTTLLADDLVGHEILFVVTRESEMAAEQVRLRRFPVVRQGGEDLAETVLSLDPDLVINDILDTQVDYMGVLRSADIRVVNFEDLGSGAGLADLVVNAIYEEGDTNPNHLNGPDYFCIRDEFLQAHPPPFRDTVAEVLITFGGTDPNDKTRRIAKLVLPLTSSRDIRLSIVTGPGYLHLERLKSYLEEHGGEKVELANGTKRISEYMARADLAFSSAGRTVFELAAMRTPALILASHAREQQHTFASEANGMFHLGQHDLVTDSEILDRFREVLDSEEIRRRQYERTGHLDFRSGRQRVLGALNSVLDAQRTV